MPDLLSKSEVATLLEVSEKTVQRMTSTGELPIAERRGQTPYYDRAVAIEAWQKHAEAVTKTLQNPGGDVLAESRLARVESHYRRQDQKLEALMRECVKRSDAIAAWDSWRRQIREICLAHVEQPPFIAGLTFANQIGMLITDWQNQLLHELADTAIAYKGEPEPDKDERIMGEPTDVYEKIEAARAKVNYTVADYNNALADLLVGTVIKMDLYRTAASRRVMVVKNRIESMSTRLTPQLIGSSQARVKEMILELINEALEELTDIDSDELFDKAILDLQPDKPMSKAEVNED